MSKGYMRVKVAVPDAWRQRSHVAWEQASGRPLPAGWIVRHKDNDPLNDDPENLVAMSRGNNLTKTLEDPVIAAKRLKQTSKADRRRWKKYREKKRKEYDTYYWEME